MNAFDALGLPLRLTLTSDEIDAAFREAGKAHHPDAGGDETTFATLRQARATLASPASRLAHWLDIHGQKSDPRGAIDAAIMDLFASVGEVVQQADSLSRRRSAATTALGKALLEGETLRIREATETMIARVDAAITAQCESFALWEAQLPDAGKSAATLRNLRFLEKWKNALMAAYSGLA